MSGQFKVGEVLVGQNHIRNTEYNGMECIVTGELKMRRFTYIGYTDLYEEMRYKVQWANGIITSASQFTLRRKQPPAGEQSIMDMFKRPAPRKSKEAA